MQNKQRFVADQRWDKPQYDNMLKLIEQEFQTYANLFFSPDPKIVKNWAIENAGGLVAQVNIGSDSVLFATDRTGKEDIQRRLITEPQLNITLPDNSVNYIEVQIFEKTCAPDTVAIWDTTANGGVGSEFTQTVDTQTAQDTQLVSNTIAFTGDSDKLPLAVVTTSGGVITLITDVRDFLFHLDSDFVFGAPRTDQGNIQSIKDMFDAITTIIKEDKGTAAWYTQLVGGGASTLGLLERMSYQLTGGGKISFENPTANTVAFTSDLVIQVPNRAFNYTISAGTFTIANDEVAYVTLPDVGAAPGGPLAISKVANGSFVLDATNTRNYILAYKQTSGNKVYFGNGWTNVEIESGESIELGDGITDALLLATGLVDENDATPPYANTNFIVANSSFTSAISNLDLELENFFGQLKLTPHESAVENARVSGVDRTLLDGRILSQELSSLVMEFTGAVIEFDTGSIFKEDGTTPLGVNFTPFTIPVSEYFWYSVVVIPGTVNAINQIGAQVIITPAASANAVKASAPLAPFASGGKKIGQVLVQNIAGVITIDTVRQLGVGSGSGGGDANSLDSLFDDILRESIYELQETNIFEIDGDDKFDSGTATIVSGLANFAGVGNTFISTDALDIDEFLGHERDINMVQLIAIYDLLNIDDGPATFEFSRDGQAHWQEGNTPIRVGEASGQYEINHTFKREKDISVEDAYDDSANADTDLELTDTGSDQKFSQEFVLAATTEIKEVSLYLSKLGTPVGNFQILLHADDGAGDPGVAVATSGDILVSSVPGSSTKQTLNIGDLEGLSLAAGTYHMVVQTDDDYKTSFATGVDALQVSADSSAPTPPVGQQFNGTVWADVATTALTYEVKRFDDSFQNLDEHAVGLANGVEVLNITTQIKLGQPFVVPVDGDYVIQRLTAYVNKLGTPIGNCFLQIVRDDGSGDPSTNSADIMVESGAVDISALGAGDNTITEVVSDTVIPDGTFHLVMRTDATYAGSFSSGVDELRWRRLDTAPVPPVGNKFDGATWSDIATTAFVYLIEGRPLELAVRITSSKASKLKGYAINYDILAGTFQGNNPGRTVIFVNGDDDVTDFQLTFLPAASTLLCFDVFSGQVYRRGAFEIIGQTVVFESGTFADPGAVYMLEFIALEGGQFDNSDTNRALLAENYLGSLNPAIDQSVPGRGGSWRANNGKLVEAAIEEDTIPGTYKWVFYEVT